MSMWCPLVNALESPDISPMASLTVAEALAVQPASQDTSPLKTGDNKLGGPGNLNSETLIGKMDAPSGFGWIRS